MNAYIKRKINTFYDNLVKKPYEVLKIFSDFYGEEFVDLQGIPSIDELEEMFYSYTIRGIINEFGISTLPVSTKLLKECTEEEVRNFFNNLNNCIDQISKVINIYIYFPEVKITNEYDKYRYIHDLYVKVPIKYSGTLAGKFKLSRSSYSIEELKSNYMHSHVSTIPTYDFSQFQSCCLGSGPIRNTINNLIIDFDENIWNLFCLELSKYVETESIEGVPYHRLEGVTNNSTTYHNYYLLYSKYMDHIKPLLQEFIPYFIRQKKLKFNFINGKYSIGMSFIEYVITISNCFIEWYNKQYLIGKFRYSLDELIYSFLQEGVIKDNKIYTKSDSDTAYLDYQNKFICTFKGKDVLLKIKDCIQDNNYSLFLNIPTAMTLLHKILKIINCSYGNEDPITNTNSEKVYLL